jgi:hypothetical protein
LDRTQNQGDRRSVRGIVRRTLIGVVVGHAGLLLRSDFDGEGRSKFGLPATTMTSKRGRASPDGRSQPRVNSRCKSETTQIRTSVLIITVGLFGQSSHRLDQRVVVSDLLDAERELYVGRAAARASVPSVVLKRSLLAAGATAKSGHRYRSEPDDGGETSVSESVSRS